MAPHNIISALTQIMSFCFLVSTISMKFETSRECDQALNTGVGRQILVHFKGDFERLYGISNCGKYYVFIFLSC